MAEDDEVDVLGDFNLGNFLSKNDSSRYESTSLVSQNTELLNCDYTIHPQWLLDKPSANPDNWYGTNVTSLLEKSQIENDTLGHVSTENCITDESGWTEKEKDLLERGIEIFGKSNVRLSQFIGSKTASEVKYYLKNFYLEGQTNCKSFNEAIIEDTSNANLVSDILDDAQIPASIEEVIAAVSTAKPTIHLHNKKAKKKNCDDLCEFDLKVIPSGHSLLKSNYVKYKLENSTKETKHRKTDLICKSRKNKAKLVKFKFKAKLKVPIKENKRPFKQKTVKIMNEQNRKSEISKVEITTGKGLGVPLCEGEEIIKIKKVESDSDLDVEVDVEVSDEEIKTNPSNCNQNVQENVSSGSCQNKNNVHFMKATNTDNSNVKFSVDLSTLDKSTVQELMSLEIPQRELLMDQQNITEIEKVIHNDFFEGRTAKTPLRYLKIRNYILNTWNNQKPNYVKKIFVRQGLKNGGDINSIGRIHHLLEQIGAINYGCEQVNYVRPLLNIIQVSSAKEHDVKVGSGIVNSLGSRPRNKKKFTNDGEGGCTLTHDEDGHVINTTVINEEPVVKQKLYIKKPVIRLIYCRPFTEEKPQPYSVEISLSTLLTMDFHAHISLTEVMGLVAGYWIPENKTLTITHYEPCLNIASSATHCDMCPISQAKAADIIHGKGLDILGWFHSHPTFAPEPSHQDLETQQFVQQWIGNNKPCIGVILSPFSANGALIASPFTCMVVDLKHNFEDQFVPYKFKVHIISEDFVVKEFIKNIKTVLKSNFGSSRGRKVDFNKPYFQDSTISYLEKYITSVRMHLARCGTLNKMTCDNIIQTVSHISHITEEL